MAKRNKSAMPTRISGYDGLLGEITEILDVSRRATVRSINSILTATYWEIGRRVVEFEQRGELRAEYGDELMQRLAHDLSKRHGRGFSDRNLLNMRTFYVDWEI